MEKIQIIHSNDIHSNYESFLRIASKIKQIKENDCIILDAGDFNDFSSYVTKGNKGYTGLKMLSDLGYQALTIGNNEGFQDDDLISLTANYDLVNILSINLFKLNDQKVEGIKDSIIVNCKGYRFLIIGVSPFHSSYNLFYNFHNVKAVEPYNLIEKEINDNKGKYDFVILLSHLGLKTDILLTQVVKGIDIIVEGHSHHVIDCVKVNGVYLHQSGYKGSHLGELTLCIEDNKIVDVIDKNHIIDECVPFDESLYSFYLKEQEKAYNNLSYGVAKIEKDLSFSIEEECNFTNLICDYLFNKYDCDFSLINSGLTASRLKKGNVTYNDVLAVCNSPLQITYIEVLGKHIKEAILESASKEKCHDGYRRAGFRGTFLGKLHVSNNVEIIQKDSDVNIFINNQLIQKEKYYKIITTDYFHRGMGYEVLINNKNGKMYKETIVEAIINALNDKKSFDKIENKRWR